MKWEKNIVLLDKKLDKYVTLMIYGITY